MSKTEKTTVIPSLDVLLRARIPVYFVGIGGIGMHALALFLHAAGYPVSGSDCREGPTVSLLRGAGIPVTVGHRAENVRGAGLVVLTLALPDDDPEARAAREAGIPCVGRAELLGWVSRRYACRVAVAGTHGKSTTTAMLAAALTAAGADPTVITGAPLARGTGAFRRGAGETFLCEACEYGDSFLALAPTVAVALNMEREHTDYFREEGRMAASFYTYLSRAKTAVIGADCPALAALCPRLTAAGVGCLTFGFGETADLRGGEIVYDGARPAFPVFWRGKPLGRLTLAVPGAHNAQNALACLGAMLALYPGGEEAAFASVRNALAAFPGVPRRLEYRGERQGARIYEDYAHHPTEIRASLATLRRLCPPPGRLVCVFQPHTFSRTLDLFDGFVSAFREADRLFFLPVYAARESGDPVAASGALAAAVPGAVALSSGREAERALIDLLGPGDLCVVMGAGDADGLADRLPETPAAHF